MNEQRDEREKRPRLNLTTSQVVASALAACCASVVASYLGVAGTVIGAAVGSVVATTGAAVYGHLFRRGSARLRSSLQFNGRIPDGAEAAARAGGLDRAGTRSYVKARGDVGGVTVPGARPVPGGRGRFYSTPEAGTAQDETRPAGPGGRTTAKLWLPASSAARTMQSARIAQGAQAGQAGQAAQTARLPENARISGPGSAPETAQVAGTARRPQTPPAAGRPTLFAGATVTGRTAGANGRRPAPGGTTAEEDAASRTPGPAAVGGIRRYRKPIGVAAAIVAVFCVSITVGFLAGAPVRSSGSNSTPPATTATHPRDTQGAQGGGQSSGTEPSPSSSATPSGSASGTPSPSAGTSSAGTPSTPPSATAGASGGAATATGQPTAGATDPDSNAP